MKSIQLFILSAGLSVGCANSEFRVLDEPADLALASSVAPGTTSAPNANSAGNTSGAGNSTGAQPTNGTSSANGYPATGGNSTGNANETPVTGSNSNGNTNGTPVTGGHSNGSSTGTPAPTPAPAARCAARFETGFLCESGTGLPLADNANAESLCRSYCDGRQAACCALGRSNIAPGKVFCHASAYARLRYVNNYAQLQPNQVAAGRTTSIAAMDCAPAQARVFSWGAEPKTCLKNFDFRLYGQVPANADVLAYTGGDLGLLSHHWWTYGHREGRDLNTSYAAIRKLFNADLYLAEQPDVLLAGVHPWSHYQSCGGAYEGRRFPQ